MSDEAVVRIRPDRQIIRELEALKVGPDEVLLVRMPLNAGLWPGAAEDVARLLEAVGLKDRALVFSDDFEFAVAKRGTE